MDVAVNPPNLRKILSCGRVSGKIVIDGHAQLKSIRFKSLV